MQQNEQTYSTDIPDDYTRILPVFKFPDENAAQSSQAAMDEIIKKNSIVIQLHEKSKWVDDSYFLIGKANFYKQSYAEALTSFQYIISEYSGTHKKKKKKKKPESAEMSLLEKLQHQPVHNEASLWVVHTLIAMEEYNTANTALTVIESDKKFPENLLGELYATEADAKIRQNDLAGAIEPLVKSIDETKDKATRARYHFILSQLYTQTDEPAKAIDELKTVISLKPDYKMDFYARLHLAELLSDNSGASGASTIKMLSEMLKQEKYKEFYSLLYNTIATLELQNNDTETAIEHLHLAVQTGDSDPLQKAVAYMRLGDINYTALEYLPAYGFYDSSLISLPRENERYNEIVLRRDGLNDLVKELRIIETEKKLQYFASLSDKELAAELAKMIPETESTETGEEFLDNTTNTNTTTTAGSTFYFYDAGMRSRGFGEFKKIYGSRKLEDNWRRSDKSSNTNSEEEEQLMVVDTASAGKTIDLASSTITRDDIMASIPRTKEQLDVSNARIATALYNSGRIYKINFGNMEKAKTNFEENISVYPKNSLELQSMYQLYLLSDGAKKTEYRNNILQNYPNSLFANIINDPDYITKKNNKDAAVVNYYNEAFANYEMDSINALVIMLQKTDSLFKTNPLKPKFDMLNALVLAKQGRSEEFVTALQAIVKKYPKDEVGIKAKEILGAMGRDEKEEKKTEAAVAVNYTFKADEEQYFVAVINATGKDASVLKTSIANFNGVNYSLANLKISSLLLGKDKTIIMVKAFKSVDDGMGYYNTISADTAVSADVNEEELTYFLISKSNYIQFYKSKDVDTYEVFFDDNYFKDGDDD